MEFAHHEKAKLSPAWKPPKRSSNFWKDAIKALPPFWNQIKFRIGNNGRNISFWKDNWLCDAPLKRIFPSIYARSSEKRHDDRFFFFNSKTSASRFGCSNPRQLEVR